MARNAVRLILTIACSSLVVSGCVSSSLKAKPEPEHGKVFDVLGSEDPYPCVRLTIVERTDYHVLRDPCDKCCFQPFRVYSLQILRQPGDRINWLMTLPGDGFFLFPVFMVRHCEVTNIILAPGFNALAYPNTTEFWKEYYRNKEENDQWDAEFVRVRSLHHCALEWTKGNNEIAVPLIPLYPVGSGSEAPAVVVNHSILLCFLSMNDVWADLRAMYGSRDSKEAVSLICTSVVRAVDAHQEKWPMYRWGDTQEEIIKWCRVVTSERPGQVAARPRRAVPEQAQKVDPPSTPVRDRDNGKGNEQ